jgi:hypothetical protein
MTIVVGKVIAVVFVDIELLIFNLPARACDLHHRRDIGRVHVQIRNPTMVIELFALGVLFPDFDLGHAPRPLHG